MALVLVLTSIGTLITNWYQRKNKHAMSPLLMAFAPDFIAFIDFIGGSMFAKGIQEVQIWR